MSIIPGNEKAYKLAHIHDKSDNKLEYYPILYTLYDSKQNYIIDSNTLYLSLDAPTRQIKLKIEYTIVSTIPSVTQFTSNFTMPANTENLWTYYDQWNSVVNWSEKEQKEWDKWNDDFNSSYKLTAINAQPSSMHNLVSLAQTTDVDSILQSGVPQVLPTSLSTVDMLGSVKKDNMDATQVNANAVIEVIGSSTSTTTPSVNLKVMFEFIGAITLNNKGATSKEFSLKVILQNIRIKYNETEIDKYVLKSEIEKIVRDINRELIPQYDINKIEIDLFAQLQLSLPVYLSHIYYILIKKEVNDTYKKADIDLLTDNIIMTIQ